MEASRFDRISKLVAGRRSRGAPAQARLAAQGEAAPAPADQPAHRPELLFVQSFRAGAIAPKPGADGRYTLALEAGTGQTVYFSDRPDRLVGATPTGEFLDRLGFPADDPPNAALVFETAPGGADVAVVELFAPVVDAVTGGVTYEVAPLANWQEELGVGLLETPTDLATLASSFGTAHLFIDGLLDCPDGDVVCHPYGSEQVLGTIPGSWFNNFCSHQLTVEGSGTRSQRYCVPCGTPKSVLNDGPNNIADAKKVWSYWGNVCNERIPACNGNCRPTGWCAMDPYHQEICPGYNRS